MSLALCVQLYPLLQIVYIQIYTHICWQYIRNSTRPVLFIHIYTSIALIYVLINDVTRNVTHSPLNNPLVCTKDPTSYYPNSSVYKWPKISYQKSTCCAIHYSHYWKYIYHLIYCHQTYKSIQPKKKIIKNLFKKTTGNFI